MGDKKRNVHHRKVWVSLDSWFTDSETGISLEKLYHTGESTRLLPRKQENPLTPRIKLFVS